MAREAKIIEQRATSRSRLRGVAPMNFWNARCKADRAFNARNDPMGTATNRQFAMVT
jgi:hypothetical protein